MPESIEKRHAPLRKFVLLAFAAVAGRRFECDHGFGSLLRAFCFLCCGDAIRGDCVLLAQHFTTQNSLRTSDNIPDLFERFREPRRDG
jgi:hypothetical protein